MEGRSDFARFRPFSLEALSALLPPDGPHVRVAEASGAEADVRDQIENVGNVPQPFVDGRAEQIKRMEFMPGYFAGEPVSGAAAPPRPESVDDRFGAHLSFTPA